MDMPTVTETTAGARSSGPAPAENPRAADTRRAARPHTTESITHGAVTERGHGREGGVKETHVAGRPANRVLSDRARTMLANLDKYGDVAGDTGAGRREGVSAAGTTVTERSGAPDAPAPAEKPADKAPAPAAEKPVDEPAKDEPAKPAAVEKPAEAAAPDPKLTSEVERLQAHNRKLAAELEGRSAPQFDDRMKELDSLEKIVIENPIGALERIVALAIGAKDPKDPDVQRFLAGAYGDWTERELKVPMDKAARAEFGSERNRLLIQRDRRDRDAAATAGEAKGKAERRQQDVRDTVSALDRQLASGKHGDKFPLLMQAEHFDGITPGQKLFTAISQGIAAGDWEKVPADDVLVEHYSKQIEKEYEPRDQKLRAFYVKPTPTSTATQTQPSDSSKEKAADAPAKAEQAGVRTITNASASVAPPTPPAATAATPPAKDSEKPKWRNEAERRIALARQHFGDD